MSISSLQGGRFVLRTLAIFISINVVFAGNFGHRGGSDYHTHLPENSLIVLEESLVGEDAIQFKDEFEYLEFDVQETADGELVVFHDSKLRRMIPNEGLNKEVYDELLQLDHLKKYKAKKLKIKHLTLEQIKLFHLKDFPNEKVPTLKEFLDKAKELGLKKPMAVEIKSLKTEEGREKLLELVSDFYQEYMRDEDIIFVPKYDMSFKVGFLSFWWKFKSSFGWGRKKKKYWCNRIIDLDLSGVYMPIFHNNMCKKYL